MEKNVFNNWSKLLLIFTLVLVSMVTPLSVAQAQTGNAVATNSAQTAATQAMNLTLSPVSLALEADPGVPVKTTIRIRNNSDLPETLKLTVGSFIADETGAKPQLLDPSPEQEFLNWLTPSQDTITARPNEWTNVELTFAPPASAALSYYYAIYIQRPQTAVVAGEASIQGSPAILVLTTVRSPNAKRELELTSFKVDKTLSEFLPRTFEITIKNTGNVHIVPSGNIFIDGQRQKDIAVISINPASSSILPQSSRTFTAQWIDGFPFTYSPDTEAAATGFRFAGQEWDLSRVNTLRMGTYTAHLLMVYDNGERDIPIESFANFWVIPWKLLLVALAISLFALVGIGSTLKSIWKKLRPSGHQPSA